MYQAAEFAAPVIKSFKAHLVYLLLGICDITMVRTRNPWSISMRHISPDITTYNFMISVDQLHSQLYAYNGALGHSIMIVISSQTSLDIGACSGYPEGLASPEQPFLDRAIIMINKQISLLNKSMSIVTPFLSSAIHMRCRGRYRTVYNKFADACHPTLQLCRAWAYKLLHNLEINTNLYDSYVLINHMYA